MLPFSGAIAAEPAAPANTTSVYAGLEWGNTDSRRVDVGAAFRYRGATEISGFLARGNASLPEGEAVSTFATGKVTHDFGRFGAELGVRHSEVEDVSTTRGEFAGVFADIRELRISAEYELRDSDLARSAFTEDFGPGIGLVSGTSRCSVSSNSLQVRVTLDRPRWSMYAAARSYDYADFECELSDVSAGAGLPPGRSRAIARRLAERALQPVSGFASRLMPREATLLASSVSAGVTMPLSERWYGGVEMYHDVEKLSDTASDTALAFAGLHLRGIWNTEASVGYTDADGIEDTAFVGLRVTATL
jgi:hypothetical protein